MKISKQYIILYITLLFCSLIQLSCSGDKKEAAEFFERGNYHFKKNELDKAQSFFEEAIKKQPDLADAYNNLGFIFEKQDNPTKAKEFYLKATEIDTKFSEAKLNLARITSLLGENETALSILTNIEKDFKDSSNYYNERGQVYFSLSDYENAEKDFQKAIDLRPNHAVALINLGVVNYQSNRFKEAEVFFMKALKINDKEAFVFHNLSNLAVHNLDFKKGLDYSTKALELNKKSEVIKNNHAFTLLLNQQTDEAGKLLHSLSTSTKNSYFLRNEGFLQLLGGNKNAALQKFEEAEKLDPSTEYIYYFLSQISGPKSVFYKNRGTELNDVFLKNNLQISGQ
jgi:tetratricopeptide (TPR) repeat protein